MKDSPVNRVKEKIMADVISGQLSEGSKLPSVRALCYFYGTSKDTICKAIAELTEMGILEHEPKRSTRVKVWNGCKIAVIYASITHIFHEPFWSEYYFGIKEVFDKTDRWKLDCMNIGNETAAQLSSGAYAGIISIGFDFQIQFQEYSGVIKNLPIVLFSTNYPTGHAHEICWDLSAALAPVKEKLSSMKPVRCLFLTGHDYYPADIMKTVKYQEIVKMLRQAFPGKEPDIELVTAEHENDPELLTRLTKIFKRKNYPNFCVVYTDRDAPFLFRALHDTHRKCPEDVQVLSYDNLPASRTTIPSQTSIEMHRRETGRLLAQTMLDILEKRPTEKLQFIRPELITRESLT